MAQSRRAFIKGCITSMAAAGFIRSVATQYSPGRTALFWEKRDDVVACLLCPNGCLLKNGQRGLCRTRQNREGVLYTHAYNNPCAINVDPIEKKPLFHVTPGAKAYSIAIAGCTLHCKNCQNYTISQAAPAETDTFNLTGEQVVDLAKKAGCSAIAYTYSEPTAWFEYMVDTAEVARRNGLKNLLITCGYINPQPLKMVSKYIDAANIDLKSFSDSIYRKLNAGKLAPILETIKLARSYGIWVELTNLVVPQWTDNLDMIREMCLWIKNTVGLDVPLHFSRFFPMYQLSHLIPTPTETLLAAKDIALDAGLRFVYIGNVADIDPSTYCPWCTKPLIIRKGYTIVENNISAGVCESCKKAIPGVWK
ncbi:MAG: AmmeMemoRadiSam system radical SAM enzyme [Chitinivibrionales bacterium]|nr:AmmeMemoRadiSam system radical SAM enzyme [Chitinivibrionales bacterium]